MTECIRWWYNQRLKFKGNIFTDTADKTIIEVECSYILDFFEINKSEFRAKVDRAAVLTYELSKI